MTSTENLTLLGSSVKGALSADQLEKFPAPNVSIVKFETAEVTSLCPVTDQPDIYTVTIEYVPGDSCVESKSLKMYLTRFRNQGIFGEALAATIADDIYRVLEPKALVVTAEQQMRGGLIMTSTATRGGNKDA